MWSVHYRIDDIPGLRVLRTRELAIESACHLLDNGVDVRKILRVGTLEEIDLTKIMTLWVERKGGI
jgi:hypothetical protein